MADIKTVIAKINKDYGEETLKFAKDLKHVEIKRIPSGSLFLDWALGITEGKNSGWPLGRLAELYGPYSSGKSLISMLTVAEAQKAGLICAYIDAERAFDKEFATTLGIDSSKLLISREANAEKVFDLACDLVKEKVSVIVIDSIASLVPTAELDQSLQKATMAELARVMSKGLRKINLLNRESLVIFINQLRERPGVTYGNPEYTPGGRSLGFYASLRVEVRRGDWIINEKKKAKVGQVIKFRVVKNKTASPYKEGFLKFFYEGYVDKQDEIISLGLLTEVIQKKGSYFYIGDEGFQGRDKLEQALKNNEDLYETLRKEVFINDEKRN